MARIGCPNCPTGSAIPPGRKHGRSPWGVRPGVPFGGYKQSGFGRELALETLEAYLETKSVLVGTGTRTPNPFGL